MKPDMKSTNENENRRGLLISAGQLLFGERWQTELARALGLTDGRRISVLQGWRSDRSHPWLAALLSNSCPYFGNALGPEYNAAHANHFHFGMRGQGFCF